jgi:hypothetical protein
MARKRRSRKSRALAGLGCGCGARQVSGLGFAVPSAAKYGVILAVLAAGGWFAYKKFVR